MKRFQIDWRSETGGRIRVNINIGAMIDSFEILENKYIAESWAKRTAKQLEAEGHHVYLALDEGRLD